MVACWPIATNVKGDSAGARYLRYWLYWPVRERAAAGTIIAGDIFWPVGRLLRVSGRDRVMLAATPALVEENLMQAGAITMLTVRLGRLFPMLGHIACQRRRSRNYGLAAVGIVITLLPLLTLPRLLVPPQPRNYLSRYWRHFVFARRPLIGGIALLGGLVTMASAVMRLHPALAMSWQMSAAQIGLLYAAPAGAPLAC